MNLSSRSYLFDAGVISLYYAGALVVRPYFERVFSGRARGFVSEVNLAEFYYKTVQKKGAETAEIWYLQVRQSRIRAIPPNQNITRQAAIHKIGQPKLSLADCFALATCEDKAEVLLTTDSELKEVRGKNAVLIPVEKSERT